MSQWVKGFSSGVSLRVCVCLSNKMEMTLFINSEVLGKEGKASTCLLEGEAQLNPQFGGTQVPCPLGSEVRPGLALTVGQWKSGRVIPIPSHSLGAQTPRVK